MTDLDVARFAVVMPSLVRFTCVFVACKAEEFYVFAANNERERAITKFLKCPLFHEDVTTETFLAKHMVSTAGLGTHSVGSHHALAKCPNIIQPAQNQHALQIVCLHYHHDILILHRNLSPKELSKKPNSCCSRAPTSTYRYTTHTVLSRDMSRM